MIEDEIIGWHHQVNGHEFEQALGDGEGQGSLASSSPQVCKESDMTEQLSTAHFVGEREPIQSNWNTHQLSITIKCCDKCFLFKCIPEFSVIIK